MNSKEEINANEERTMPSCQKLRHSFIPWIGNSA